MRALLLAWRMLWRDLRAGELQLLALALIVAVASLSSVGFLGDRISRGLDRDAAQLLGGDLLLHSDSPWTEAVIEQARQRGLKTTETVLFASMLSSESETSLAGVKVVAHGYPLRGTLRIADAPQQADREVQTVPAAGEVWLDERLLAALRVSVGERVHLGLLELTISAMLSFEADRGNSFFSFQPRAIFNRQDLERSGLIVEGSRANWRLHLAGEATSLADFQHWLQPRLTPGQAIELLEQARPEVRAALDTLQRFLRLAALLAVVLASVAVGLGVRRFLLRHLDACAVMRCLGAGQRQLLTLVLLEFFLFGIVAGLLGASLGWLVQFAMSAVLNNLLQLALPAASWRPWLYGLLLALVLLGGFVLPQLLRLTRVPPLRVLRRELASVDASSGLAWLGGVLVLVGLMLWVAGELRLGLLLAAGFALSALLFALLACLLLTWLSRQRSPKTMGEFAWRYGLLAIRRRMGSSVIQTSALALGLSSMLLLVLVRGDFLADWQTLAPPGAPNSFLINIQPSEQEAVTRFFVEAGLAQPQLQPMIRGRLVSVNAEPVVAAKYADARARRLIEREFNLSYGSVLPLGNRIIAGHWHGEATPARLSVEAGLAETLSLTLGDKLGFELGSQRVEATITSVRQLEWNSMQVNFFFIASPGVLADAPSSMITSFYLPPSQRQFSARLIQQFPSLTMIDIEVLLGQLRGLIERLSALLQFIFVFALLASAMVLFAAMQSTHEERGFELAVLRTLGARNRQLRQIILTEFLALAVVTALLAVVGAAANGWLLAHFVFKQAYAPDLLLLLPGALCAVIAIVAIGWFASVGLLRRAPLQSLSA